MTAKQRAWQAVAGMAFLLAVVVIVGVALVSRAEAGGRGESGWGPTYHAGSSLAVPPPPSSEQQQRERSGERYVTPVAFVAALRRSPWPEAEHAAVLRLALCEAPGDADGDGVAESIDTWAVGVRGEVGALQIHPEAHPRTARALDLFALADNLIAARLVYLEAQVERGRTRGWEPWGCSQ